jgi:glycosyltransferase involved in cell wall biosynthesis
MGGSGVLRSARLRRAAPTGLLPPGPALGGLDRVHDGLASGWLACPACDTPPTPLPELYVDGHLVDATVTATPRPDVPGGRGFVLRFPRTGWTAPRVSVRCPEHQDIGLVLMADPDAWGAGVLGGIETSTWPIVTGWFAALDPTADAPDLVVEGYDRLPVRGTVARPDAQAHLGTAGVSGFQLDLGAALAFAVSDGTRIELRAGPARLAQAEITGSPIDPVGTGCLPPPGGTALTDADITSLQRRFADAEIDTDTDDWHVLVTRLGQVTLTDETHQRAAYLAHAGHTPQQVAATLVLRDIRSLGIDAVNPLPRSLATVLPEHGPLLTAGTTTTTVTHLDPNRRATDRPHTGEASSGEIRVAVAGLVRHKSGLGHSASNSIRILEGAGIHACAAPLFPAPGGWNAGLSATREAVSALHDHTVLLHMTMDRVIPTLAAQPALMATNRLIGYFYWEIHTIPQRFHRVLNLMDEVWCATEFIADAYRAVTDTPVHVTGQVVDVSGVCTVDRAELGIRDEAFVVHYSFDANSTVARKNPNAGIDAFTKAFGSDPTAVFVLKIRNMAQVEGLARSGDWHARGLLKRLAANPAIRVVTEESSYGYALGLIQMADCYLSLHRAEGFGYGVAEAMALGTPVVTTAHSGTMDLTDERTAWLVPCVARDVHPGEYFFWEPGMAWAEPDVHAAASALGSIRAGERVRERVESARVGVSEASSMQALCDRYAMLLAAKPTGLRI